MLSQSMEYALRAATDLAARPGRSATTEQVAARTGVPPAYLAKILQSLARAGIVRSQRGVGGGVSLAGDPADISLLDVVTAIEPFKRPGRRPGCPLGRRLAAVCESVEQQLADITLADVVADVAVPV
jgi:Rrf2 family protein